jgi:hypothetical protein
MERPCANCSNLVPIIAEICPHCDHHRYPNVLRAELDEEREALGRRYQAVHERSRSEGDSDALEEFERALGKSKAVISLTAELVKQIVTDDCRLYASFYELMNVTKIPKGEEWEGTRGSAEFVLFRENQGRIRFAALSLDGRGLSNYAGGECIVHLREHLIANRTTVFEENNVIFYKSRYSPKHPYPPPGHTAVWTERARLGVAKLGNRIKKGMKEQDFADLLLKNGADSWKDEFIEVHVFGKLSRRAFEHIGLKPSLRRLKSTVKVIRDLAEGIAQVEEVR